MRLSILVLALASAALANDIIDGEYMVVFQKGMIQGDAQEEAFTDLMTSFDVDVQRYYHFPGTTMMYAKADAQNIARVSALPEVAVVEPNQIFYSLQDCSPVTHTGVWGLDRIDDTDLPLTTPNTYKYGTDMGSGVRSYVIDTGINISHNTFQGRAEYGASFVNGVLLPEDDNGHGTHCAGTIGGAEYGVAKQVTVVAVKVLNSNGSGFTSDIVAGCEWVAADGGTGDNANLSLGGGANTAMDQACEGMYNDGVSVVVAAGNSNANACLYSPAREPTAITVGATTSLDSRSSFSNFGTCLDVFAPGSNILSAWIGSDTATNTISGTSMAAPHVAGAVSRYQSTNPGASPFAVTDWVLTTAIPNMVSNPGTGSDNLMLYAPC